MHAGLVDVGILYATLFEEGILHLSSVEVVVLTCWPSVEVVVTYIYSWSWILYTTCT